MTSLHVTVDSVKCMSTHACVDIAPDTFAVDEHGHTVALRPHVDDSEDLREAEESCPVFAILLTPPS